MPTDDATTTRIEILMRRADGETLSLAAKSRRQSLSQFLAEVLTVTAADLRQPPRAALTWLDTFSRRVDLPPENDDTEQIRFCEPRSKRAPHRSTGPTTRSRQVLR